MNVKLKIAAYFDSLINELDLFYEKIIIQQNIDKTNSLIENENSRIELIEKIRDLELKSYLELNDNEFDLFKNNICILINLNDDRHNQNNKNFIFGPKLLILLASKFSNKNEKTCLAIKHLLENYSSLNRIKLENDYFVIDDNLNSNLNNNACFLKVINNQIRSSKKMIIELNEFYFDEILLVNICLHSFKIENRFLFQNIKKFNIFYLKYFKFEQIIKTIWLFLTYSNIESIHLSIDPIQPLTIFNLNSKCFNYDNDFKIAKCLIELNLNRYAIHRIELNTFQNFTTLKILNLKNNS